MSSARSKDAAAGRWVVLAAVAASFWASGCEKASAPAANTPGQIAEKNAEKSDEKRVGAAPESGADEVGAAASELGSADELERKTASKKADTDVGQVVGKVVGVRGEVTAHRLGGPAAPRPLEKGSPVFADDVVTTNVRAKVSIVLLHNNAVWRLRGGKTKAVKESAAWAAPRGAGGGELLLASAEKLATTSAGRNSEKEAATTAETAARSKPSKAHQSDEPEPAPRKTTESKTRKEQRKKPRKKPRKEGINGNLNSGGGFGFGGSLRKGAKSGGRSAGDISGSRGSRAAPSAERSARGAMKFTLVSVSPAARKAELAQVLRRRAGSINRCYEMALRRNPRLAGEVQVAITVGTAGRITSVRVTKQRMADKTVIACVLSRLKLIRVQPAKQTTSLKLKLTFARR